jgi:hypothetical protein
MAAGAAISIAAVGLVGATTVSLGVAAVGCASVVVEGVVSVIAPEPVIAVSTAILRLGSSRGS